MDVRLNRPREQQARRELGHTDVAGGLAWFMVGAFLLSIISVGGIQHLGALAGAEAGGVDGPPDAAPLRWAVLLSERPTDCSLEAFERHLEGALVVGRWALPKVQLLLTGVLGVGKGSRQEPRLIDLRYRVPGAAGRRARTPHARRA